VRVWGEKRALKDRNVNGGGVGVGVGVGDGVGGGRRVGSGSGSGNSAVAVGSALLCIRLFIQLVENLGILAGRRRA
jgi:hypothetical protein